MNRLFKSLHALFSLMLLASCVPEDEGDSDDGAAPEADASFSDVMGDAGADADAPTSSASCFSPTQNLDIAYEAGASGCACVPLDALHPESKGECRPDSQGRLVALLCLEGRWRAVEDGPCIPYFFELANCFSPEANLDRAYEKYALGCECDTEADEDVCVADSTGRDVALVCQQSRWHAVLDGPCHP